MALPDEIEVECEFWTAGVLKAALEQSLGDQAVLLGFRHRKHKDPTPRRQVVLLARVAGSADRLALLLRGCLQLLHARKPEPSGRVVLSTGGTPVVEIAATAPLARAAEAAVLPAAASADRVEITTW